MEPTRKALASLARILAETAPEELDCQAILDGLAPLLEQRRAGAPIGDELARVRQHLAVCPECLEEYEALERSIEESGPSSSPSSDHG